MAERKSFNWRKMERGSTCPICGDCKPNGSPWCTASADGKFVRCMKVESKLATKGGGYIHKLTGEEQAKPDNREPEPKNTDTAHWTKQIARMYYHDRGKQAREKTAASFGVPVSRVADHRQGDERCDLWQFGYGSRGIRLRRNDRRRRVCDADG